MPIAISGDYKALSDTARDFLAKNRALAINREMLEAEGEGDLSSGMIWCPSVGSGCISPKSTAAQGSASPSLP
jgi:hypothetical protein